MAKSKTKKNKQFPLMIAAAALACAALAAVLFGGDKTENGKVIRAGESLSIPKSHVTETASFYPVEVDDVAMEVLAIRDSEGNIRTAFNTCQSCYSSGKGYYEAEGTELVCQNCGFRFTAEQVQVRGAGGCNPYPIFAEDKTETEEEILISYDVLHTASDVFTHWRG